MLNKVIKYSFAIVGGITGFTLTKTLFVIQRVEMVPYIETAVFCINALLGAFLFYLTGNSIIKWLLVFLDKIENLVLKLTLYELTVSSIGLIIGLIVANLVTIPIAKVDIIGVPLAIAANILFGCIGISIAMGKRNEHILESFKNRNTSSTTVKGGSNYKVLDTSVIIDGRIIDICRSGFIEGELVVPSFVLEELRHIADSSDSLKRNRGRRGLDVLNSIQKELGCPVRIEQLELPESSDVDSELLKTAKRLGGKVLTIDYNLNKVASLQEVPVLNINELANAVKPIALPGEEMTVQVIKDGKENGQGVGYLDDGTMIVVDGGRQFIGENVNVTVTSVLQTAAGRMIFAKPKLSFERVF